MINNFKNLVILSTGKLLCFCLAVTMPLSACSSGKENSSKKKKPQFVRYNATNKNVKAMAIDGDDLWIGTSDGLLVYDKRTKGNYRKYSNDKALLSNSVFSITVDKHGNKWIGTYGGGLSVFDGKKWKNFNVPNGLCDSFVYDVEFMKDGTMWIATWSGANRVQGDISKRKNWNKFTVENTNRGLGDNWVYGLAKDSSGVIWFGTEVGISKFDKGLWKSWDHKDGMGASSNLVNEDNAYMNNVLEGTHHKEQQSAIGLFQKKVRNYNPNYVVAMIIDPDDNIWIGTWGGGLSRFDTKTEKFKNYTTKDGLPSNYIFSIEYDHKGDIWIGSNKGLSKFDGINFINYKTEDGLFSDYVFSILFDSDNTAWIGSWGGVSHILNF